MSFKKFSSTHNSPATAKPAADAAKSSNGKAAPLVDQPPAPAVKAPAPAKPADKP